MTEQYYLGVQLQISLRKAVSSYSFFHAPIIRLSYYLFEQFLCKKIKKKNYALKNLSVFFKF